MNRIERVALSSARASEEASGFAFGPAVRVERAAAELRAGRPVIVEEAGGALAVLAPDAATPAMSQAFAEAVSQRQGLYLSPARVSALGATAPSGLLVPVAGLGPDAIEGLQTAQRAAIPDGATPAGPLAQAASQLARLALLLPGVLLAEIDPLDPSFKGCARVAPADLAQGWAEAGRAFEIVARSPVPLQGIEAAEFVVFRGGLAQRDQVAIVVGSPDSAAPVPVRVHSSCLTGDLFGSLKCDCGDQLRGGVRVLQERGGGVLVYLDQEGRGTGIASKMRAYHLQCDGLDTVDADATLGFGLDERRYEAAVAMLQALGYPRIELLTNNPLKVTHLQEAGIEVAGRSPMVGEVTQQNRGYLRTKAERAGHLLDVDRMPVKS